jgi:DNA-binding GntR family transcriptional regulator
MIRLQNRRNLRGQIAERISEALLVGELRPGERIIETKLARDLGVGQSTLREGLQELEHRGLLTKHGNRGTFVSKLTERRVKEIYSVRFELEPVAAALACAHITTNHSSRLRSLLEQMERTAKERNLLELIKSDQSFHQLIWSLSNNTTLENVLDLVCAPLFAFYLVTFSHFKQAQVQTFEDFVRDQKEHCNLLAALNTRNPAEAKRVFREVLEIFCSRHIKHVREAAEDIDRLSPESQQSAALR